MKRKVSRAFVERSLSDTIYDFGNGVLYYLCEAHPRHVDDDVIVAKVWLIGRSYAAAIERGRNDADTISNDLFYKKQVAPKIRDSPIDEWFRQLREDRGNEPFLSLKVHDNVSGLFAKIAGRTKRSLASKYLHFHFPDRFFIYDSRAASAVRSLIEPQRLHGPVKTLRDRAYVQFWLRCDALNQKMEDLLGRRLRPRELDKVLLAVLES